MKTLESKFLSKVDNLETKIKSLETENANLKSKINEYHLFSAEEPTSKMINTGKEIETSNIQQTENNIMFKRPKLECNICSKEFKNKNTLKNHDEKFHISRGQFGNGSSSFKCDNCNKKFTEKNLLENHILKEHIRCSDCKKVFPSITTLNIHITAVHDNLTMKHDLEREPSLKNHKIRKPA